jgi:selenocysteine-specific elongation factor
LIIGTAGHIDHGKTSLVKALTGVDADRLKEEKARGITIDLGFAYKATADGGVLGFVDVPGHEKLVRNMLAGATGIDHVMLVVAADDGPMPQTREHLAILDLLGLGRGVVVLNKCDLVTPQRLEQARAEVQALLAGTALAGVPVLPVSSTTGQGLEALQAHLDQARVAMPAQRRAGHFRLAVDRCFSLTGIGTLVTGTAVSGQVAVGDKLLVSPSGKTVRVRGLHAQNLAAETGHAGQRLALNLTGVEKADIHRGDWILAEAVHAPTQRIEARLRLLASEAKALEHWTPVHLHLGALDVGARVVLLEGQPLQPGASALVQIELAQPNQHIGALRGDRFIVRDQSALRTLGGGAVLDIFAPANKRRKSSRLGVLAALEQGTPALALDALLQLRQSGGVDLAQFNTLWNLSAADAADLAKTVPHRAVAQGDGQGVLAFHPGQIEDLFTRLSAVLAAHHKRAPDSPGLTAEVLHKSLTQKPSSAVFGLLMLDFAAPGGGLQRQGPYVRLAGHEATLLGAEQKLWERLQPWLLEGGYNHPPKLTDILARDRSLHKDPLVRLLHKLARMGKLYVVSEEYFVLPKHLARLAAEAQQLAEADENKRLNVKAYRESTGISRHLSMPLVEFFDHIGFTKRDAVGRKIRRTAQDMFGG